MAPEPATLVNCHTHLELGWLSRIRPGPEGSPFADWLGRLIQTRAVAVESGEEHELKLSSIEAGISDLIEAGTTHVGDITASGLSIEPLLDSGLAGVVYVELLGLDPEIIANRFETLKQLISKHRPQERNGMRIGISPHAPYSIAPQFWPQIIDYCRSEDLPVCIHAAESPAESQALMTGRGPLADLVEYADRPHPGLSPVEYLEELGALELKPLLVHMVQVSESELNSVAASGSKIAHCPRSNRLLQCGTMPLASMLDRGIPVALGTDSLASSPSLDIRDELKEAFRVHEGLVVGGALNSMTANSAVLS